MNITDWIAAISSFASLVVAIFAAFIAWRVHKREAKRAVLESRKEIQHQANLVSAWETSNQLSRIEAEHLQDGILSDEQLLAYGESVHVTHAVVNLANRSTQPVFDLQIHAENINSILRLPILPPGEQQLPTARYTVTDYSASNFPDTELLLNISFKDAAGNWWVRQTKGTLINVSSEEEYNEAMGEEFKQFVKVLQSTKFVNGNSF